MLSLPKIADLYDLDQTLAAPLLGHCLYPWEALPKLADFIRSLGKELPRDSYTELSREVWVHNTARIAPSALLEGPAIICEGAELRHSAYLRGSVLVGRFAVVGNSTELKNAVLFDGVQVPHFNYVGDSILGHRAHLGAGAICSNVKSDHSNVSIRTSELSLQTGLRKVGAFLGDGVEVGCNSVLCPGTVIGRHSSVYPLSCVRGVIPENCILKGDGSLIVKQA
ncbi:MAG: UDP-N-acetylglucosamine pyrophosphorylase [Eubacteriales bacterium]